MLEPDSVRAWVPDGSYAIAPCKDCDRETRHCVCAEVAWRCSDRGLVDWLIASEIIQGQECITDSFCREYSCSEDIDHDPHTRESEYEVTKNFYPSHTAGRREVDNSHYVPKTVYPIYREAIAAHVSQLPILVGFAVRAISEEVCCDKQIVGVNPEEKIDDLSADGLITQEAAKLLHSLRFMGNHAAHKIIAHTPSEPNTALDIVDILLQNVYVLPRLAKTAKAKGEVKAKGWALAMLANKSLQRRRMVKRLFLCAAVRPLNSYLRRHSSLH